MGAFVSSVLTFVRSVLALLRANPHTLEECTPKVYSPSVPVELEVSLEDKLVSRDDWDEPISSEAIRAKFQALANGTSVVRQATKKVLLDEFVRESCPSLFHGPFLPSWWLPSGHAQTFYCVMDDFTKYDQVEYERIFLRVPEGGTIGLDFCPPRAKGPDDNAPIIVVTHGLTGGSFEGYIRCVLATACAPKEHGGLGYRACVMNFRGCAGVPMTTYQYYSPSYTDDLRTTLLYIANTYPGAPLLGLGFSIGASVLTRYLGEEGRKSRFVGGCAVACPWDMHKETVRLETSWFHRNVYSKALAQNVLEVYRSNLPYVHRGPPCPPHFSISDLFSLEDPTFAQINTYLTSRVGGSGEPWPFPDLDSFLIWGSSQHRIKDVRVPLLTINAEDDPIVQNIPIHEVEANPEGWVVMSTTLHGGHLGWFEGNGDPLAKPGFIRKRGPARRWVRKPILEWLQALTRVVDIKTQENELPSPCYIDEQGFMREEGKQYVAYKVLEGDGGFLKSGERPKLYGGL